MIGFFKKLFGTNEQKRKPQEEPVSVEEAMEWQADGFIKYCERAEIDIDAAKLDFSEQSLAEIDRFLGTLHSARENISGDLHDSVSAYFFEVARREFGGSYLQGDDRNPLVLAIGEPESSVAVCAMSKIEGRVINGEEDSIPFFYAGIAPALARGKRTTLV